MHMQSCCFAHKTNNYYCFFYVVIVCSNTSWKSKLRRINNSQFKNRACIVWLIFISFIIFLFQSNECESPGNGDLRYGHAFDSRCSKHSPVVSPNASSPALTELARTPDCSCQVYNILAFYCRFNLLKDLSWIMYCTSLWVHKAHFVYAEANANDQEK